MQITHSDPGTLRHELGQLIKEIFRLGDVFTHRGPLWEGNVYILRRRCGKPTCHCAEGELHAATVLADRSGAVRRTVPLRGADVDFFQPMTKAYGRFRDARARLTKIHKRMLQIIDLLGEVRLAEGRQKEKKRHEERSPP